MFDKELGKRVKILKSDYDENKDRFYFCVIVVDLNTGEKKSIPTFEFYANRNQYATILRRKANK